MMASARIIVVEEEHDMRALLVRLLVGQGFLVAAFDDSDEAIAYAATSIFPIVFFFGGTRLFYNARARRKAKRGQGNVVKVILATGYDVPQFAGVDVLKKPFDIEMLFAAVAIAA